VEDTATIRLGSNNYNFPVLVGTEGEVGIDLRSFRDVTGAVVLDEGYANTGSCLSEITFVDGEAGILRYRGFPIEELAAQSNFLETAHIIIYGDRPSPSVLSDFQNKIKTQALIHEDIQEALKNLPSSMHPMGMLAALVHVLGAKCMPDSCNDRKQDLARFNEITVKLMAQVATLVALIARHRLGLPIIYPHPELSYVANFLHILFSLPHAPYTAHPHIEQALDLILLLHADHEQNCSTSTVRMVASGGASPFACVSAGISALWGPLHGGANMAVIQMLQSIHNQGGNIHDFIESVKAGSGRLMGFGHRVYKNYDPRAKIMKETCQRVLSILGTQDPLLMIAQNLEAEALSDLYFTDRKLYPNVDFYSGLILRAIGIPLDLFTAIFALGRLPGWLANWREVAIAPKGRIYRPRQIYTGPSKRSF